MRVVRAHRFVAEETQCHDSVHGASCAGPLCRSKRPGPRPRWTTSGASRAGPSQDRRDLGHGPCGQQPVPVVRGPPLRDRPRHCRRHSQLMSRWCPPTLCRFTDQGACPPLDNSRCKLCGSAVSWSMRPRPRPRPGDNGRDKVCGPPFPGRRDPGHSPRVQRPVQVVRGPPCRGRKDPGSGPWVQRPVPVA